MTVRVPPPPPQDKEGAGDAHCGTLGPTFPPEKAPASRLPPHAHTPGSLFTGARVAGPGGGDPRSWPRPPRESGPASRRRARPCARCGRSRTSSTRPGATASGPRRPGTGWRARPRRRGPRRGRSPGSGGRRRRCGRSWRISRGRVSVRSFVRSTESSLRPDAGGGSRGPVGSPSHCRCPSRSP